MQLAEDLTKTRLEKLARIQPAVQEREEMAQKNIRRIVKTGLLPYQLKTFTSKPEALAWLRTGI